MFICDISTQAISLAQREASIEIPFLQSFQSDPRYSLSEDVDLIIQMNTPERGSVRERNSEVRKTLDMFLMSGGLQVSVLCWIAICAAYIMYIR